MYPCPFCDVDPFLAMDQYHSHLYQEHPDKLGPTAGTFEDFASSMKALERASSASANRQAAMNIASGLADGYHHVVAKYEIRPYHNAAPTPTQETYLATFDFFHSAILKRMFGEG